MSSMSSVPSVPSVGEAIGPVIRHVPRLPCWVSSARTST